MRIAVIGAGDVGLSLAALLALAGPRGSRLWPFLASAGVGLAAAAMLLYLACLLALLSRFDLSIHTLMRDSGFLPALHAAFPWMAIGMIALFIPLKLYSSLWEFAGVESCCTFCVPASCLPPRRCC